MRPNAEESHDETRVIEQDVEEIPREAPPRMQLQPLRISQSDEAARQLSVSLESFQLSKPRQKSSGDWAEEDGVESNVPRPFHFNSASMDPVLRTLQQLMASGTATVTRDDFMLVLRGFMDQLNDNAIVIGNHIADQQRFDNDSTRLQVDSNNKLFKQACEKYSAEAVEELVKSKVNARFAELQQMIDDVSSVQSEWKSYSTSAFRVEEFVKQSKDELNRELETSKQQRNNLAEKARKSEIVVSEEHINQCDTVRALKRRMKDLEDHNEAIRSGQLDFQIRELKDENDSLKEQYAKIEEENAELKKKCNAYEARFEKLEGIMNDTVAGQTRLIINAQNTSRRSRAEHETVGALLYRHEHVLRAGQMVNVNLDPSLDQAKLAVAVEDLERPDKVGWSTSQPHTPPEPAPQ
ncbi:hypothetical protein PRZ48_011337 [Zasmidium cellare]|uniref:Uncharacterized protein n=1 Tax=Zasmidium cellare TaxID=395010 RepID=A0ABR0E722_ZASCE|nr:hypothetical protein PRZ48_011337 [Zasmidium cellare]